MRPPEEVKLDLVSQWLNKAEDDYLVCQRVVAQTPFSKDLMQETLRCAQGDILRHCFWLSF